MQLLDRVKNALSKLPKFKKNKPNVMNNDVAEHIPALNLSNIFIDGKISGVTNKKSDTKLFILLKKVIPIAALAAIGIISFYSHTKNTNAEAQVVKDEAADETKEVVIESDQAIITYNKSTEIEKKPLEDEPSVNAEDFTTNIVFDNITTSKEDWKRLYNNCIEYSNNDQTVSKMNFGIKTAGEYVDADSNTTKEKNEYLVCDELYLQDAVILRFVNSAGDLSIISSKDLIEKVVPSDENINENEKIIIDNLTLKNDLYDTFVNSKGKKLETISDFISNGQLKLLTDNLESKSNTYKPFKENNEIEYKGETDIFLKNKYVTSASPLFVSQDFYFNDLQNIFVNLLTKPYDDIDEETKAKIDLYFVDNGLNLITNDNFIELSESDIDFSFILPAKSSIDAEYVDRVILQFKTQNGEDEVETTLILKLDKFQKIFDIVTL